MYYNVKLLDIKPSTMPGINLVLNRLTIICIYLFLDGDDNDDNGDES